jgi:hypothetical protein
VTDESTERRSGADRRGIPRRGSDAELVKVKDETIALLEGRLRMAQDRIAALEDALTDGYGT